MSVIAETIGSAIVLPAENRGPVAIADPRSPAAEQFRVLYQRIERISLHRPLRVLAVTSSTRREGRTTTAVNLALTAAQAGRQVMLLDCDLRRPSVGALLDLAPAAGIAEVLAGRAELGQALCRVGKLAVLCAGDSGAPAEVFRSPALHPLMDNLRTAYELVVLDVPPALAFADGEQLAAAADGALLVVRAHATPRAVVRLAVESLGEKLAGIVLNDVDMNGSLHGRYLYADSTAA